MSNKDELNELLKTQNITKRVSVPALEEIMYKPIPVLDHGFIRVVDYMGDDSAIVQAARVSYGRGTKKSLQDKGLINYLMRHRHTTPFEMCDIKLHVKLPIFVARQWIRHRTASVNEYSARYSILSNEFYLPLKENLAPQSSVNKQGRSHEVVPDSVAERVLATIKNDSENCYKHYTQMMNQDESGQIIDENNVGITRELARINLTLNHYTEWYWKINLHNLFHFVSLRADPHAQYEIRVYADAILDVLRAWVPFACGAFEEHRMYGASLSRKAIQAVRNMIKGEEVTQPSSGMSEREWSELMAVIRG
jgi:thymidylate synthase (FAD)